MPFKKIENTKESSYGMYLDGFHQAVTQVKHSNASIPINLEKVNHEKKDKQDSKRVRSNQLCKKQIIGCLVFPLFFLLDVNAWYF